MTQVSSYIHKKNRKQKQKQNFNNYFTNTGSGASVDRRRVRRRTSNGLFSDVHKDRLCSCCILCKENSIQFTHPVKWKNSKLFQFLLSIEPELNIQLDSCVCWRCRDHLGLGVKNPENYTPRWSRSTMNAVKLMWSSWMQWTIMSMH